MKTFILIVMTQTFYYPGVNGGIVEFQEFNSLEQCNYVRKLLYAEEEKTGTGFGLKSAICVAK